MENNLLWAIIIFLCLVYALIRTIQTIIKRKNEKSNFKYLASNENALKKAEEIESKIKAK